ncbi:MAG: hypothetical protein P8K77_01375 [Polaribacter sp.]|nr:hypothetical protein [Polaribacter sp.]
MVYIWRTHSLFLFIIFFKKLFIKNLLFTILGLSIIFGCSNSDSGVDITDPIEPIGPSGNTFPVTSMVNLSGQWEFYENNVSGKTTQKRRTYRGVNLIKKTYNDSLDVGVLAEAISPLSGELSDNETITAVIGNYGYLPIFEEFLVSYKIAYEDEAFGEEISETYTITDSLASVDYTYFDFATTADLSQPGAYTIQMSTHMETDMDSENNTYTRIVHSLTFSDVCNIHSLIFEESNSTFKLYTLDENGVCNYVIIGDYTLDQENNIITLFVNESGGSVTTIGHIYDAAIDDDGGFIGAISVEGLCVQLLDGFEEESYASNLTYIPDDNLESYLISAGFDDQMDDYVITSNVSSVSSIAIEATDNWTVGSTIGFWDFETRFTDRISNLAGIEAFPNLMHLNLRGENLDSINITQNSNLISFDANFNTFNKLDTSGNPNLQFISIDSNEVLPELDFSNNNNLIMLSIPMCSINGFIGEGGYIDISNLTQLEFLDLYDNNLTSVDISNNPNLKEIRLNFTYNITSMDFSNNTLLETVLFNNSNLQGVLDVSMCENLVELNVSQNPGLNCIKVNAAQLEALNSNNPNYEWEFDSGVTISLDCN